MHSFNLYCFSNRQYTLIESMEGKRERETHRETIREKNNVIRDLYIETYNNRNKPKVEKSKQASRKEKE